MKELVYVLILLLMSYLDRLNNGLLDNRFPFYNRQCSGLRGFFLRTMEAFRADLCPFDGKIRLVLPFYPLFHGKNRSNRGYLSLLFPFLWENMVNTALSSLFL